MIPIFGIALSVIALVLSVMVIVAAVVAGPMFMGLYQATFYESELETATFDIDE